MLKLTYILKSKSMYTREQIQAALKAKGYVYFEDAANKTYDVNIVGVRNSSTGNKVTNVFDDMITISYKDETGAWVYKEWMNTTEPGKKGVMEYHNAGGVARLVEGQYRGSHALGLHQGKYEALRQAKSVKVYRDKNKDMTFDETKIDEGIFGINIHKAGKDSTWVENWSEGCQVFKRVKDFDEFMKIVKKSAKIHGNSFTYTLIESNDIV
jgi:hypothetical protein